MELERGAHIRAGVVAGVVAIDLGLDLTDGCVNPDVFLTRRGREAMSSTKARGIKSATLP
jgi:hypothetical protein